MKNSDKIASFECDSARIDDEISGLVSRKKILTDRLDEVNMQLSCDYNSAMAGRKKIVKIDSKLKQLLDKCSMEKKDPYKKERVIEEISNFQEIVSIVLTVVSFLNTGVFFGLFMEGIGNCFPTIISFLVFLGGSWLFGNSFSYSNPLFYKIRNKIMEIRIKKLKSKNLKLMKKYGDNFTAKNNISFDDLIDEKSLLTSDINYLDEMLDYKRSEKEKLDSQIESLEYDAAFEKIACFSDDSVNCFDDKPRGKVKTKKN